MSIRDLARSEIRDLVPYDVPEVRADCLSLNANEAPLSPYQSFAADNINRYPELRPRSLRRAFSALYEIPVERICPVRGSSEGIDLIVRTFCRAYSDNVVVLPPTFDMYAAYAAMQAAEVRYAPLLCDPEFSVDWQAVEDQCNDNTRVVFLCSPNNPTGNLIPRATASSPLSEEPHGIERSPNRSSSAERSTRTRNGGPAPRVANGGDGSRPSMPTLPTRSTRRLTKRPRNVAAPAVEMAPWIPSDMGNPSRSSALGAMESSLTSR